MSVSPDAVEHAVQRLREGGVVVVPTETAYGLVADATNARAVERVYQIKGRKADNPVGLIVADLKMAKRFVDMPTRIEVLAKKYWPGPLTIVAPVKTTTDLAARVVNKNNAVALRVSSHPVAHALTTQLGRPVTATSANRSGNDSCYTVPCVKDQFGTRPYQPDLYLDAGALPERPTSTIVTVEGGELRVLRAGSIDISSQTLA